MNVYLVPACFDICLVKSLHFKLVHVSCNKEKCQRNKVQVDLTSIVNGFKYATAFLGHQFNTEDKCRILIYDFIFAHCQNKETRCNYYGAL